MIEDQIADGDFVIVRKQRNAHDGQIVVAQTDEGEATLKRFYLERNRIRLEPANSAMKPIYVKNVKILGVVVGVVRQVE
jgi:repressor LexA